MSREIKFRAVLDDNGEIRIVNVQSINWFRKEITFQDGDGCWTRHFSTVKALLQYTGLKDKNGKDIYEGDILRFNSSLCDTGEVEWFESGWLISGYALYEALLYYKGEVIGNIYENGMRGRMTVEI